MSIELTAAQTEALARFAAREGTVALHQIPAASDALTHATDVYVTPHGSTRGFKIAANGAVNPIGEMLPAPE
jgi:hypothetical protein